eukprot:SAG31_NODE_2302_length_5976_cov_5.112813_1_plen_1216_part_00
MLALSAFAALKTGDADEQSCGAAQDACQDDEAAGTDLHHISNAVAQPSYGLEGGTLYIGLLDGTLMAVDLQTGMFDWSSSLPSGPLFSAAGQMAADGGGNGALMDDGGVMVPGLDGSVFSLQVEKNELTRQSYNVKDLFACDRQGYCPMLKAAEGPVTGSIRNDIYALDPVDGKLRYYRLDQGAKGAHFERGDGFVEDDDDRETLIVGVTTQSVRGTSYKTGVEAWNFSISALDLVLRGGSAEADSVADDDLADETVTEILVQLYGDEAVAVDANSQRPLWKKPIKLPGLMVSSFTLQQGLHGQRVIRRNAFIDRTLSGNVPGLIPTTPLSQHRPTRSTLPSLADVPDAPQKGTYVGRLNGSYFALPAVPGFEGPEEGGELLVSSDGVGKKMITARADADGKLQPQLPALSSGTPSSTDLALFLFPDKNHNCDPNSDSDELDVCQTADEIQSAIVPHTDGGGIGSTSKLPSPIELKWFGALYEVQMTWGLFAVLVLTTTVATTVAILVAGSHIRRYVRAAVKLHRQDGSKSLVYWIWFSIEYFLDGCFGVADIDLPSEIHASVTTNIGHRSTDHSIERTGPTGFHRAQDSPGSDGDDGGGVVIKNAECAASINEDAGEVSTSDESPSDSEDEDSDEDEQLKNAGGKRAAAGDDKSNPVSAVSSKVDSNSSAKSGTKLSPLMVPVGIVNVSSRYAREFQEVRRLGRGGQGTVFVVENMLDGIEYAVKKVLLPRSDKERDRVLREVKSLAKLDHVNIVRYYQAWIEQIAAEDVRATLSGLISPSKGGSSRSAHGRTGNSVFSSQFSLSSYPSESSVGSALDDDVPADREVLFIQMKLCQDKTLAQYLEPAPNRHVYVEEVLDFFTQILEGLEHVHDAGLIHRDLKPANIFLSKAGSSSSRSSSKSQQLIKIGDFGLSKESVEAAAAVDSSFILGDPELEELGFGPDWAESGPCGVNEDVAHTTDVGTYLYASPEQMRGVDISEQADIFSAGVILAELFSNFTTMSERVSVLSQIRARAAATCSSTSSHTESLCGAELQPAASKNSDPEAAWEITKQFNWVAQMVMRMLHPKPAERPAAAEVRQWAEQHRLPRLASRNSEASELSRNSSVSFAGGALGDHSDSNDPSGPINFVRAGLTTLKLMAVDVQVEQLQSLESQIEQTITTGDSGVKVEQMSREYAAQGTVLEYRVSGLSEPEADVLVRKIEELELVSGVTRDS